MATMDSDTVNYRGQLFMLGANQAPFLNAISGRTKRTRAFTFPIAVTASPASASADNVIAEDTASASGTADTVALGQDVNVCQIMKYKVETTLKKESVNGQVYATIGNSNDYPIVNSGLALQRRIKLIQAAKDLEYCFLNNTYVAEGTSATVQVTRGLKDAIATNTVAAGSKKLEKGMIEELVREMVASGAPFENVAFLCNSFQMQQLSDIYGYAPMDRTTGGVAIDTFLVPGAPPIRTLFSPQMPTDEVYLVDLNYCAPVFCPVPPSVDGIALGNPTNLMENGVDVGYYPIGTVGAMVGGFLYMQPGLDHGPEEFHGSITGLATTA